MTLILTSGPDVEPVSLAEAKAHLRVDQSAEDTLIASLIVTSRLHIEAALGLALITQGWTWLLDAWPDLSELRLPMRPVRSIASIRVCDVAGIPVVLDPDSYRLDGAGAPARIIRQRGAVWPSPGIDGNGIEVNFVAGFGDTPADVPQPIRHAVLLLTAHWYDHREPVEVGSATAPIPPDVSSLLAPYRTLRL
ncbi:MAG: hypothetical protein EKK41_07510 [Hyphomicrobiales bacterium]|nr:MAG: hypothetical protein EKK41_07510 [Hyphomicrobiales bacterium]